MNDKKNYVPYNIKNASLVEVGNIVHCIGGLYNDWAIVLDVQTWEEFEIKYPKNAIFRDPFSHKLIDHAPAHLSHLPDLALILWNDGITDTRPHKDLILLEEANELRNLEIVISDRVTFVDSETIIINKPFTDKITTLARKSNNEDS